MKLKPEVALEYAKVFTIAAIEHSMIAAAEEPKETAKNVSDFFNSLMKELLSKEIGN